MIGQTMHHLCQELFPICRSLSGKGVRDTLQILKTKHLPDLSIHEVPTGMQCFDWTVPSEWNIEDAYILDPSGRKIVDFKKNNLHVVGYSVPIDREIELDELQEHLHSLPEQPNAIPYITSYYEEYWGFCLTHEQRRHLSPGRYRAVIRSRLEPGFLTYGELMISGASTNEVFLSTYICHPSMANNELSGPVVSTFLAKRLSNQPERSLSYRFVFVPETIGSLIYLSRHLNVLKTHVIAGFNLSCLGDDRATSFLPSRGENTLADRVARHVLRWMAPNYITYSFLDRGSDERQYCAPGIDLPVASIMRSKYGTYPEYHTSLDDFSLVTPTGLQGGYDLLARCLEVLERNCIPRAAVLGEPQLGKRGLYPALSTKDTTKQVKDMMNLLAYSDGSRDLIDLADKIGVPCWNLFSLVDRLRKERLLVDA